MPTIQISPEQAQALARGENITIAAPKLRTYIAVLTQTGNVYRIKTTENLTTGENYYFEWNGPGVAECVAVGNKTNGTRRIGDKPYHVYGPAVVAKVPA